MSEQGTPRRAHHAELELQTVLAQIGISATLDGEADLVLDGGARLTVSTASRPTRAWLRQLVADEPSAPPTALRVLVADGLGAAERRVLEDAGWGWFDRSGHLRLVAGPVMVDRAVDDVTGPDPAPPDPLGRPTGLAVALALLVDGRPRTVRELARDADVSPAGAHGTLAELREIGLLAESGPTTPELFWAVAERWRTRWFALAQLPSTDVSQPTRQLVGMQDDRLDGPGWADVGDAAASRLGVDLIGGTQGRFYVPDQRALTWTLRTWGEAADATAAPTLVTVPPTLRATAWRSPGQPFPLAHPVVVALRLAADPDRRGRDALDTAADPPEGVARVW